MKKIKIKFVDFWNHFNHSDNFVINLLKQRYHVQLSERPEYIFFSNFGGKQEHFLYEDCVKIFYTQENIVPDFNLCDYGIGFEWMHYSDRYFRYPLFYYRYIQDFIRMTQKHLITEGEIATKNSFCSMVVSNGEAVPFRLDFFRQLCKYKKVNSGGRFMNNIGQPTGVKNKRRFQEKHKFVLCFENSSHEGYTTEKIVEAFAAGTIPIYWGDTAIHRCFNTEAFVNVHDYSDTNAAIQKIIAIDTDDALYHKMLRTPALVDENRDGLESVNRKFADFIFNIFDQPLAQAYRRNRFYWGARYQEQYFKMREAYLKQEQLLNFGKILFKKFN